MTITSVASAFFDQSQRDILNTVVDELSKIRQSMGASTGGAGAGILVGTLVKDYASLAAAAQDITGVVTVTGAALGDLVLPPSCGVDLQGMQLTGYVSSANNVTMVLRNGTAGAIDLASTTFRCMVIPQAAVAQALAAMILTK